MAEKAPVSAQSFGGDEARPLPRWAKVRRGLEEAQVHWLATVRPDGRPHLMPVPAVWVAGALHFCAGATSRKGKDLARDPRCVITAASDTLHLVVEGEAAKVRDEARLRRVAEAYASKYGWDVTVRGGALCGDGPPTAGPPPYEVYEVIPTATLGFGTDESLGANRWRVWRAPGSPTTQGEPARLVAVATTTAAGADHRPIQEGDDHE